MCIDKQVKQIIAQTCVLFLLLRLYVKSFFMFSEEKKEWMRIALWFEYRFLCFLFITYCERVYYWNGKNTIKNPKKKHKLKQIFHGKFPLKKEAVSLLIVYYTKKTSATEYFFFLFVLFPLCLCVKPENHKSILLVYTHSRFSYFSSTFFYYRKFMNYLQALGSFNFNFPHPLSLTIFLFLCRTSVRVHISLISC